MKKGFCVGFVAGAVAAAAYWKWGSWSWIEPSPVWAKVVFFPGVMGGMLAYGMVRELVLDGDTAVWICVGVGVLAEGLVAGGLCAAVADVVWFIGAVRREKKPS